MDIEHIHLLILRIAVRDSTYRDVLHAIAEGIRASMDRINELPDNSDPEWQEIVGDEESDLVENLLGAAFVVCQTQITAVTSRALRLRKRCEQHFEFAAYTGSANSVWSLGEPLAHLAGVSKVEMILALANYFKHHEEWPSNDWSKLNGKPRKTADTIQQIGLRPGSSGNLRIAAELLGNAEYRKLDVFGDIVDTWAKKVLASAEQELRAQ